MKLKWNRTKTLIATGVVLLPLLGFFAGRGFSARDAGHENHVHVQVEENGVKFWTCSMHPQIRMSKPGRCPIGGMDLIPVSAEKTEAAMGPRELKMTPASMKLASVEVAPVERKFVSKEIRMVGKVVDDETRLAYITAWVPGRLDRLYVDYTGVQVSKGDHMVYLYSPELLAAQEELIQALDTVDDLKNSDISMIKERSLTTVESSREKLRLWGLTKEQIEKIEKKRKPDDHLTIYAPISGIVIHKNALEGMYVKTGTRIYTISDLTHVWVKLDAYESDLSWIRYGQDIAFETEAYPGEKFHGTIAFIDPVLDEKTRTVKVRVNVENHDGRLKPGMFTRALVRSRVTNSGKVMDPNLAGKWIGPMHPEIVADEPGVCPICGMSLVPTESLGYVVPDALEKEAPLVIPASAPLITGKRALVYVAMPDMEGHFEGREVVLGPRAGDYYIVREGLQEGERVVVRGNFKIDSAVQILAQPSMMNPKGGGPAPGHHHGGMGGKMKMPGPKMKMPQGGETKNEGHEEGKSGSRRGEDMPMKAPSAFRAQLTRFYESYFGITKALAADDLEAAKGAVRKTMSNLDAIDMKLLQGDWHVKWMKHWAELKSAGELLEGADIEAVRKGLARFSEELPKTIKDFGTGEDQKLFVLKCPMAEGGKGAIWLQKTEQTSNPYLGANMPTCGSVVERFALDSPSEGGKHLE